MTGCLDAALLKADIGARIMKLPPSRFLRRAGTTTGIIGLGFNGYYAINNPSPSNYAKFGVGAILLGFAIWGSPVLITVATVGNIGMIGWGIGEGLYEHLKKSR